ncbi:PIN domain-containing protein [Paracnuella aquatica]|uniref:PIN domain-containing protein n=1 Tax=Paracnuella aquatica TaxID=2268757 RepID=UPI000DEEC8E7|nr:PIN domain-containing protein [Paracnuella aquatica]RPD50703.1 PIN domain-containing protein [Paracnuella aquatica]
MNGNKIFLDTNALIAYLQGNQNLFSIFRAATWVGTSAVCIIEFLSFSKLPDEDERLFKAFIREMEIISVPNDIQELQLLADFRKSNQLKLPDAIIAAQAAASGATLVSNDKHFNNIPGLNLLQF